MKNLLIDTDCGMDDIIAIVMIISCGKFNIEGITTVRGLVTPTVGKENLTKILEFLKTEIDVVSGAPSPLNLNRIKYSFPEQDKINSSKLSFLKKLLLPIKTKKQELTACDFIYKKSISKTEPTTLLCLGPLTNIANAIKKYGNRFTGKVDQIVIMGGAVYTYGNVPPKKLAEYNIYLDPEAAEIVFSCGIPIKLISIDSTVFVPATPKFKKQIEKYKANSSYGEIVQKTIIANKNDFNYFYDPLAAGILIDPSIALKSKKIGITVLKNDENAGQTLADSNQNLVEVVTKVDSKKFKAVLLRTLK